MPDEPFGAFVISLDFELHWGVFDTVGPDSPYVRNLQGARTVVPKMLRLFRERDIAATWATVGFLFACDQDERARHQPNIRPNYANAALDAYAVPVGANEADDPLHYAPSLIAQVTDTPRQEIATHTYSHYYCNEKGSDVASFRADLQSAMSIAEAHGHRPTSIVFPRNMVRREYLPILRELGVTCYRGLDPRWMYRAKDKADFARPEKRIGRLVDRYINVSGYNLTRWRDVPTSDGLCNVPSTRYLQSWTGNPGFESVRMRWIGDAVREAAHKKRIVHLWWHPHDFGAEQEENLAMLRTILDTVAQYRESHGLRSLTMAEVAQYATAGSARTPA